MTRDLLHALRAAGVADADDSQLTRTLYATDASLYRVPPRIVVRPRHVDEIDAVLSVARETGVPVTMRGAGTSISGNAVGAGIVVDALRHLGRVVDLDPASRTATVEAGTVHATLQQATAPYRLRFGPDPSTHRTCTVGGMVGNNACGSRALGYGRTSDNVVALDAVLADGRPAGASAPALAGLVDAHLGTIRTALGRFGRQVSGYALEQLLPERGRSLDRFLAGSEGTLAVVRRATVRLVEDPPHRVLVVLGYGSMAEAADAAPGLLGLRPVACEGLDQRLVRAWRGPPPDLPRGSGWLFVEVTGGAEAEARSRAAAVVRAAGALEARLLDDPLEQLALWRVREDGAGLAARGTRSGRLGLSGWEDAAVPPTRLGGYLRDLESLLSQHGYDGVPYGHFGEGCVHLRIDFSLDDPRGRARYRGFVEDAARLVASYDGSLSGEHGDGRARSELLPLMYDADVVRLFAQVKHLMDPAGLLNPGVLVDPAPLDVDLRLALTSQRPVTRLRLTADGGDLVAAAHRCTGVGRCLADGTGSGGVMCPSYLATKEEKDSTRGRARVLQDLLAGQLEGGFAAPELGAAMDLCLACRGCARDCPTGVDMATYKAEALHQRYRGRRRPWTHYTLGRLPALLGAVPPRLANAGMAIAPRLATALAGVDRRRELPRLAPRPMSRRSLPEVPHPDVTLWVDTFTDRFAPEVAEAAVAVLAAAGQRVRVVADGGCCGLTWLATGQLDEAAARLGRAVTGLGEGPVVVLEPSCLAVLRLDAPELVGEFAPGALRTLSEHLAAVGWSPAGMDGLQVVAQPHCHHASVLSWAPDRTLLLEAGAALTEVAGCCGLAGAFGMERTPGHYEVSVAVAELALLPAVRAAGPDAVVLADGFSCRTQLEDLAGVRALHLAQLLASGGRYGGFDRASAGK